MLFRSIFITIALTFAELASYFRASGGPVLYTSTAFGPTAGFITGWILWLGRVSGIAANMSVLALYAGAIWPVVADGAGRTVMIVVTCIALTAAKRSASAPQIPTMAESGVQGVEVYEWNGLYVPANTAQAIITKLNTEVNRMLGNGDVQQRFFQLGAEVVPMTPADLTHYVRGEIARWSKTVKEMGIKGE